jgi:hypothetical protein
MKIHLAWQQLKMTANPECGIVEIEFADPRDSLCCSANSHEQVIE